MDDEAFEAHLALHGVLHYRGQGLTLPADRASKVFVDDQFLVDIFRESAFVRIDQYDAAMLRVAEANAVPGLREFGMWGFAALYTREKSHG